MKFSEKLSTQVKRAGSILCIGLDPDIIKLPKRFRNSPTPLFSFNKWVVEKTNSLVCAYKPNTAFYEAEGANGIKQLKQTCTYIQKHYPNIPIILDAKRGDIGNTNKAYAKFAFSYLKADAITLHPYQGIGALTPFLSYKNKGCFILCKTSNTESSEYQNRKTDGTFLWERVARDVSKKWNTYKNCMLVIGATHINEFKKVRSIVGNMTLLVPGIGTQGGDLKNVLKYGLTENKEGLIITVSRSILFTKNPKIKTEQIVQKIRSFL